ncbi:ATP-grasp domain-containing protein [Gordonia pseudamarae]|jgi:acetyl/propionyl-CoA carboxylase alpha subunit/acetyl-CoA carboxylase carboxyltransferase component|uniref:acetyl-CoA carboxylase n=1 Tax=Gordonia pseudamarae TaxID=2831662 RepID=A0ABX6IKH6_9ACTN|nr:MULTISPECIES: carboxyl transferase domain-containing protein [Gordonia]MBD0023873.1 ATP-grasp domain-containing protein [Gordonia sp. (in: high G+C Gram-positive bacteria)]QHN26952.1 ATP-grasp domain-containing protein [Gordonia pseudamarae]QHN35841.1 ATP-grasp domain-containing protein [Gordonia pseudamarae]
MSRVLVANRGEIALRIIATATELGMETIAVYAADDAHMPHVRAASTAVALDGSGPSAYLDRAAVVAAGRDHGADLVHPGYGFLSEDADFAADCAAAGLTFVGPDPRVLRTFGDKVSARAAAVAAGVPVPAATASAIDEAGAAEFLAGHPGGVMIKAVAGGGGRGIRPVTTARQLSQVFGICAAEARAAFGNGDLFVEELLPAARHIEVQVVAAPDNDGGTTALAIGDRDCSVQRGRQKLIEVAPAQWLDDDLRAALHRAAVELIAGGGYRGLATVEFLVTADRFVFLEVNPRIQVEHTVTEEVTGVDLVEVGLRIAQGATIAELLLPQGMAANGGIVSGACARACGVAIQTRVNTETVAADGARIGAVGTLTEFVPPTGPGVRVDTFGRPGLEIGARYDSLLAKVIAHTRAGDIAACCRKAAAALDAFTIAGVDTNAAALRAILRDEEFVSGPVTTTYLQGRSTEGAATAPATPAEPVPDPDTDPGEQVVRAHLTGIVVEAPVTGAAVAAGAPLAVLEAMKMQHVVSADHPVTVARSLVEAGRTVGVGDPLAVVRRTGGAGVDEVATEVDPDHVRADLAEVLARRARTADAARPEAVARRHDAGRRTARENIDDLIDAGSFVEYGALTLAAQRGRRSEADLIANTPADGFVAGLATIGADVHGAAAATAAVMSYDYTVLAGTQGMRNHAKTDRLLEVVRRKRIPLVLFAEGGGGRPGDTDANGAFGLELGTFRALAGLRGRVPTVAVVSGRCFAGNAALAGACDVLIATPEANIGMGGPAMVEGGGLGVYRPEEIGPIDVQTRNGVVHVVAGDEAEAVDIARRYLSYFQGPVADWTAPDPGHARHVVPENRLRSYDVRAAIDALADVGSVLELRRDFGAGVVTALIRVEGVAYGVVANSSLHLGGAIDAEASDKAADFLNLCESHQVPLVMLCDTPGFMVGPDSETEATVRRFANLFVAGARLTVPFGMIILRKAYGLGAMAMGGGSFHAPEFTVAWPTGEVGPMGLEGAVRLGFRKELESADPAAREELFANLVALAYERGKALYAATTYEIDDVIDPAASREWIRQLGRHGDR